MSRILKLLSASPIANTGSVARDHLANERTFLSWTRTGLGFVALGVALAKLDALEALAPGLKHEHGDLKIPSAALVASGTGCLSYGTTRYFVSMRLLKKGLFRPNIAGIGLVAVTSAAVAGGWDCVGSSAGEQSILNLLSPSGIRKDREASAERNFGFRAVLIEMIVSKFCTELTDVGYKTVYQQEFKDSRLCTRVGRATPTEGTSIPSSVSFKTVLYPINIPVFKMAKAIPMLKLNNGVEMPALGFGTFADELVEGESKVAVIAALDVGYRHLDCAWYYANEKEIGSALKEWLSRNPTVTRKDIFITTKVWPHLMEPEDVEWSLNNSLESLGIDYVDAFLIHWPFVAEKTVDHQVKRGPDGKVLLPSLCLLLFTKLTHHPLKVYHQTYPNSQPPAHLARYGKTPPRRKSP
ncbi:hypothetical protein G7Y89_g15195 [Cudoniella acicularis]|uniref:DUF202 domain-containing protein n=1 Tax=Cudoniella acicularis TaxID=354080 RepID=A0A8H4VNK5_9HELO|nr:hypothetical protein G7Y89_g15195 [Cudoniella acicularis]